MLMFSRGRDNQGRVHGVGPKDEGEGFELPKCIVHLKERRRAKGTLQKVEGGMLQVFGVCSCAQEAQEGTWYKSGG